MKKVLSLIIVAMLVLALPMTALAAEESATEKGKLTTSTSIVFSLKQGSVRVSVKQSADTANPVSEKLTGLFKVKGKWKYYENGKFKSATGLVKRFDNGKWCYVENGFFKERTTLTQKVKGDKKWYYVEKGHFKTSTGLVQRHTDKKWFYVKKGAFYNKFTGLCKRVSDGKWFYVEKGVFKKATKIVYKDNKAYYVEKGAIDWGKNGKVTVNGTTYSVKKGVATYDPYSNLVIPGDTYTYGEHTTVKSTGGAAMRYGPSGFYNKIRVVPKGGKVYIRSMTSGNNNESWVYVKYGNQFGWINTKHLDIMWGLKPALYLYPTKKTAVDVNLEIKKGIVAVSIPEYNNGWSVTAYPDGKIVNNSDGKVYPYLFWETAGFPNYDLSSGYVIEGRKTEEFFREILPKMGLIKTEYEEFIDFWVPRMKDHKYNLITFQTTRYSEFTKLNISPKPDSVLRVFMVYKPLEKEIRVKKPIINSFVRKGFTAVEWGGSEVVG